MFGEIDCREGLLLAVDKLKYPDLQAAMHVLADIYLQARVSSPPPSCSTGSTLWHGGADQPRLGMRCHSTWVRSPAGACADGRSAGAQELRPARVEPPVSVPCRAAQLYWLLRGCCSDWWRSHGRGKA